MVSRLFAHVRLGSLTLVLAGCPDFSKPGTSATSATTFYEPSATTGPTDGGTTVGTTAPTTSTGSGSTADTTDASTTGGPTTDAGTSESTGTDAGKMAEWGHACANDDECVALLGAGAVCLTDVLGIYELPDGYCSKTCELPPQTPYVPDDPACGRGVWCIGADGYFEACAVECDDDSECPREGYECRIMPTIGQDMDPKFCLMTDEHML